MNNHATISVEHDNAPWHLWVVGILTLLWNGSGTYTFLMAQTGRLAGLDAEEEAYYAAQPLWFAVSTDIALLTALAAGFALLFRSGVAFWLFAVSLAFILLNNTYELVSGVSRMLVERSAVILTTVVIIVATLQLVYSMAMRRRGALR